MMKSPKDQVFDWYINRERAKGGKVYERSAGIKPAIKSIRAGASFFYLPDQDHGREVSVFVPFFGRPKATLPALPKLVKLTGAGRYPSSPAMTRMRGAICWRLSRRLTLIPPPICWQTSMP